MIASMPPQAESAARRGPHPMLRVSPGVLAVVLSVAAGCSATDGLLYLGDASVAADRAATGDRALTARAAAGDRGPIVPADRPATGDAAGDASAAGLDAAGLGDASAAGDATPSADAAIAVPCGS